MEGGVFQMVIQGGSFGLLVVVMYYFLTKFDKQNEEIKLILYEVKQSVESQTRLIESQTKLIEFILGQKK